MINLPIFILVGGLATRLRPITNNIPKALVKINGVPFIKIQLQLLKKNGFKKIYLLVSYKSNLIEEYLKKNDNFGLDIKLVYDGDELLGTGGAVKKASKVVSGYFFLTYGDSYLPIDYKNLYKFFNEKKTSLMTIFKNFNEWDNSNISFDGNNILSYSKKGGLKYEYIDYGLMIMNQNDFKKIKKHNFDLTDVICNLISKKKLIGYEVYERFYEVGSFDGIKNLENYLNH
jgi:NDP-sugar pyrophosphorylase family protein